MGDDESRDATTDAIRVTLVNSTTSVALLDFCRKWSTSICMSESTVESIKKFGERMNEAVEKIAESHRKDVEPLGVIFAKLNGEGPNFNRKPAWIDARQRRPPIPERRPLAVRKWQARQAAKRKAGRVNRRRARRKAN